jgi:hypothetical protein
VRKLATVLLSVSVLTVVSLGSASGKIAVELDPRAAAPGDEVRVEAGWGAPVGPIRRLRIYLVAPGGHTETTAGKGPTSPRRRVLVLDAMPQRRHGLRAVFTVPQVPSGRYRLRVCVRERRCFPYGRFRVTPPDLEGHSQGGRGAADSPRDAGLRSPSGDGASPMTAAGVVAAVALAVAALALRRYQHRHP